MSNLFGLGCKSKKVADQVVKTKFPRPPKGSVIQPAINSLMKIEEPEQQNGCVCF